MGISPDPAGPVDATGLPSLSRLGARRRRASLQRAGLVVRGGPRILAAVGCVACLCLAGAGVAAADDAAAPRHRVRFPVERSRDVENDWGVATLRATREDPDAAQVARQINEAMSWALARAKQEPALSVRTRGYVTQPVSDRSSGSIRSWRGSQDLVIEGADVAKLSQLLGELQRRLELVDLRFSVSPERRRAVERELVDELLVAFRERAEQIRSRLDARGYAIVEIALLPGGDGPIAPVLRMQAEMAAPALEAGSSEIQSRADCTIELEFE